MTCRRGQRTDEFQAHGFVVDDHDFQRHKLCLGAWFLPGSGPRPFRSVRIRRRSRRRARLAAKCSKSEADGKVEVPSLLTHWVTSSREGRLATVYESKNTSDV